MYLRTEYVRQMARMLLLYTETVLISEDRNDSARSICTWEVVKASQKSVSESWLRTHSNLPVHLLLDRLMPCGRIWYGINWVRSIWCHNRQI